MVMTMILVKVEVGVMIPMVGGDIGGGSIGPVVKRNGAKRASIVRALDLDLAIVIAAAAAAAVGVVTVAGVPAS